jgi:hypothetical protein
MSPTSVLGERRRGTFLPYRRNAACATLFLLANHE